MAEARKLLMQAFMVDVIDTIAMEPLRDRLHHMVERRFAGELVGCRECGAAACN
jgi:Fe-S cluster assembly protein SufD